ncbi:MAG: hypothetical protein ACLQVY_14425 [Limisphaerales bacterium]
MIKQPCVKFLAIAACGLLLGCQRAPKPSDTFQLGVEEVIHSDIMDVVILTVHASGHSHALPAGEAQLHAELELALETGSGNDGARLFQAPDGSVGDVRIVAMACLTAPGDTHYSYVETTFPIDYDHGGVKSSGRNSSIWPVARGTKLDQFYSLRATNGTFKIGSPIIIGKLDGKPVTLRVNRLNGQTARHVGPTGKDQEITYF